MHLLSSHHQNWLREQHTIVVLITNPTVTLHSEHRAPRYSNCGEELAGRTSSAQHQRLGDPLWKSTEVCSTAWFLTWVKPMLNCNIFHHIGQGLSITSCPSNSPLPLKHSSCQALPSSASAFRAFPEPAELTWDTITTGTRHSVNEAGFVLLLQRQARDCSSSILPYGVETNGSDCLCSMVALSLWPLKILCCNYTTEQSAREHQTWAQSLRGIHMDTYSHLSWVKLPNSSTSQWKLQQPCFSRALLQGSEMEGRQVTGCDMEIPSLQSALVSHSALQS